MISLIIFITYIIVCSCMFGLMPSLSDSFYLFEAKSKGLGYIFTVVMGAIAFTLIPTWLDITPESIQVIPFFSAAALCFVGTAPKFMDSQKTIHEVSAYICAGLAVLWSILVGYWYIPLITVAIFGTVYFILKQGLIFWLEMAAFGALFSSLLLKIL